MTSRQRSWFVSTAAVIILAAAVSVATAQTVVRGNVVRVDPGSRVIVLDTGQTIQIEPGTELVVNGQRVVLEQVQPGTVVTVQRAQPAGPPRQLVMGVVTDVDRDGEVTIRSNDGDEFEVRVSPEVAAQLKTGDTVTMDLSFGPVTPAASPRLQ